MNRTPLRYPGGKTRARRKLLDIMVDSFDVSSGDTLLSPFFGGGSFELYAQQKLGLRVIANDVYGALCNFWQQAKRHRKNMCTELERCDVPSKTEFRTLFEEYETIRPRWKQACAFFLLNRCAFNGMSCPGCFSAAACNRRLIQSSVERLREVDLSNVEFHNYDFEDFLDRCYTPNALMFLDPPYCRSRRRDVLYGDLGQTHRDFDHERLRRVLSSKRRWMMTYNDTPYIRDLYSGYEIINVDWRYSMGRSNESDEIVIVCR